MSLKQKIQEELEKVHEKMNKEQDNQLDRGQDGKFPYYFMDEVLTDFVKDISDLLDEATKQIEKIMDDDFWSANCHLNEIRVKILTVLDGEEK